MVISKFNISTARLLRSQKSAYTLTERNEKPARPSGACAKDFNAYLWYESEIEGCGEVWKDWLEYCWWFPEDLGECVDSWEHIYSNSLARETVESMGVNKLSSMLFNNRRSFLKRKMSETKGINLNSAQTVLVQDPSFIRGSDWLAIGSMATLSAVMFAFTCKRGRKEDDDQVNDFQCV